MVYWVNRILWASKAKDKKKKFYDPVHFITRNFVERIWVTQKELCFHCGEKMQTNNRRLRDGCTIERLDNNFGHTIKNCVLACYSCNCHKAWGEMWQHKKARKKAREFEKNTKQLQTD